MPESVTLRRFYVVCYIVGTLNCMVSAKSMQLMPKCSEELDEKSFALVKKNVKSSDVASHHDYLAFSKSMVLHGTCYITFNDGLLIEFGKITKISEILIELAVIGTRLPNSIEVFIKRGALLFECKYSDNLGVSNTTYAKYSCPMNGFANALKIRSVALWTVDLAGLQKEGSLGWLILRQKTQEFFPQRCQPPGLYPGQSLLPPIKQFYQPLDEVKISCKEDFEIVSSDTRNCNRTGFWSGEPPICQPKEKWHMSNIFLNKPTVAVGMENVSFVVSFNQSFNNIRKIGFGFEIALNESETIRTLHNNFAFTIWSLNSSIYAHHLGTINFGDDAALENFAHTFNDITAEQECLNCTVKMTFFKYHWDVAIVQFVSINAASNFESGEEYLRLSKGCPPLDPYPGMPHEYSNYDLILNGSINELLREIPCREGFTFKGNKDDISSCDNGKWNGKGFPVCEAVRTKSPPELNGSKWDYVHDDAFHEIIYNCENGQNITAKYDLKADDWKGSIGCPKGDFQNCWLIGFLVLAGVLAISLVAAFFIRQKTIRRTAASYQSPATLKANQFENNSSLNLQDMHYVLPISYVEHVYEEPKSITYIHDSLDAKLEHLYSVINSPALLLPNDSL